MPSAGGRRTDAALAASWLVNIVRTVWVWFLALWAASLAGSAVGVAGAGLAVLAGRLGLWEPAAVLLFVLAIVADIAAAVAVFRLVRRRLMASADMVRA